MSKLNPSSPLLTLVVRPQGSVTAKDLLARFHPIMRSLGFGHFEQEQDDLFLASKPGNGIFTNETFVFAESEQESIVINIDGHSVFGLKGVEEQLKKIQTEYQNSIDCSTDLLGPNYANALWANLLYTALPIYLSASLLALIFYLVAYDKQIIFNIYLYATLGIFGAKTRFWVNQRRKQRPIWLSILTLVLAAPLIVGIIVWVIHTLSQLA